MRPFLPFGFIVPRKEEPYHGYGEVYRGEIMDMMIYHNPACSKSRETLALLRERGFEPTVIEYLKTPPSYEELDELLRKLGKEPRDVIRKGEDEYKALGLSDPGLTREELIRAMVESPRLIERPIVVRGERAALGRPPENVLTLLGEEKQC